MHKEDQKEDWGLLANSHTFSAIDVAIRFDVATDKNMNK
jgi:hypothetical protein